MSIHLYPIVQNSGNMSEWEDILSANYTSLVTDSRYKQVTELALLQLSEKQVSNLLQPSEKARDNILTECLSLVKKISQITSLTFLSLGIVFTGVALFGILIDSPPIAILSVLTGIAVGGGFGMVGLLFRINAAVWTLLQRSWINSYFHKELKHNQDLKDLWQWSQIKKEDLEQLRAKINRLNESSNGCLQKLGYRSETAIKLEDLIININQKIFRFQDVVDEFKRRPGGPELLNFLRIS